MRRAAPAALAVALAAAACGGASGGDRATYERDGDAICRDYARAIAKLGQPTQLGDIGPYIQRAMPVLERTVARIERLDPPADLAGAYATFRDAARQTVVRAEALRAAAEQSDGEEVQRLLGEARSATDRRRELADAAGLKRCAF